jgi:hypothetical protein
MEQVAAYQQRTIWQSLRGFGSILFRIIGFFNQWFWEIKYQTTLQKSGTFCKISPSPAYSLSIQALLDQRKCWLNENAVQLCTSIRWHKTFFEIQTFLLFRNYRWCHSRNIVDFLFLCTLMMGLFWLFDLACSSTTLWRKSLVSWYVKQKLLTGDCLNLRRRDMSKIQPINDIVHNWEKNPSKVWYFCASKYSNRHCFGSKYTC